MTAATDWLNPNIERPPLPRREVTTIYTQALAAARSQLAALEETAVLYRVEELDRLLEPASPVAEPVEPEFPAVHGELPSRFTWRWVKARLTWPRLVGGSASGLVLVITGLGRWFM